MCGASVISSSSAIIPSADAASPHEGARPAPALAATLTHRIVGYDIIRAAAAMGVIWVHCGRSPIWQEHNLSAAGSWGTAFLNSLAGYFVVHTLKDAHARGTFKFALHRIGRLYGAFLIWSLIYLLARVVNFWIFHKRTTLEWTWEPRKIIELAFFGTTYHLWFLPYLLIVTLLTLPLVAIAVRSRERMLLGAALFALASLALLIVPEPYWVGGHEPTIVAISNIYLRSPGFLTGLAIGLWIRAGLRPQVTPINALACAAIVVAAMYLSLTTELPRHILNRIAATAAFMVAIAPWHGRIAQRFGSLGQLGFGVYLCHVLFVEGLLAACTRFHLAPSLSLDVAVYAASVVCSFGCAYALRQVRWLAWVIP